SDMLSWDELRHATPQPDRDALLLVDPQHPDRPSQRLRINLPESGDLDWSHDGQWLLMRQKQGAPVSVSESRPDGLMVYDVSHDTLARWQFHDTYLQWPRWSPDDRALFYVAVAMLPASANRQ